MRNRIGRFLIAWVIVTAMLLCPQIASAGSVSYVAVTATGSEMCIVVAPNNYNFAIVHEMDEITTPYFTITSCSISPSVIRVKASDVSGASVTWALQDTPGDSQYALRVYTNSATESTLGFAAVSEYTLGRAAVSEYTLADSEDPLQISTSYQILFSSLAPGGVREYYFLLQAPLDNVGNEALTGTITLTASIS